MNSNLEIRRNAAVLRPGVQVEKALEKRVISLILEEQMSRHQPTFRHSLAVGILAPEMANIFGLNPGQRAALTEGL